MPPRASPAPLRDRITLPSCLGFLMGIAALLYAPQVAHSEQTSIFAREPDGGPMTNVLRSVPDGGQGDVTRRGSLDKEIIRRVIRFHINDVKSCYENLLVRDPWAAARVTITFTLSGTGEVIATTPQDSTVLADKDHALSDCIQHAMRSWQFPKPLGGGSVVITYPFVLAPAAFKQIQTGPTAKESVSVGALDSAFFPYRVTNAQGIPANGLVVRTDAGLLLVDAVWTDAQTEAVLKWADARFHQPWIGAVITHDHNDRAGGLAALLRRHIPVAALDLTVAQFRKRGITGVSVLLEAAAKSRLDARGFEAFYPGPGHTRDNIVVWFPAAKVLYGGCLIKDQAAPNLGFLGDADLASWPVAVGRVAERYPSPAVVIPGHGDSLTRDPYGHTQELLAHH